MMRKYLNARADRGSKDGHVGPEKGDWQSRTTANGLDRR
jgi:hypothetical protein